MKKYAWFSIEIFADWFRKAIEGYKRETERISLYFLPLNCMKTQILAPRMPANCCTAARRIVWGLRWWSVTSCTWAEKPWVRCVVLSSRGQCQVTLFPCYLFPKLLVVSMRLTNAAALCGIAKWSQSHSHRVLLEKYSYLCAQLMQNHQRIL